jgi:hypothetical protein
MSNMGYELTAPSEDATDCGELDAACGLVANTVL